jgi:hypothetical protein
MKKRDEIEKSLNNFLLKTITLKVDDKVLKKGKLKIFNIKQFFIKLNLEINNDIKVFEIPYPYKLHEHGKGLTFEYTLSSLCNSNNSSLYYKLKTTDKGGSNKIYDNFLNLLID